MCIYKNTVVNGAERMNNGKNENEISRFKKNNKLPYNVLL